MCTPPGLRLCLVWAVPLAQRKPDNNRVCLWGGRILQARQRLCGGWEVEEARLEVERVAKQRADAHDKRLEPYGFGYL